jgi:hypothetical protein
MLLTLKQILKCCGKCATAKRQADSTAVCTAEVHTSLAISLAI